MIKIMLALAMLCHPVALRHKNIPIPKRECLKQKLRGIIIAQKKADDHEGSSTYFGSKRRTH